MKTKLIQAVFGAALLAGITGCTTTVNTVERAEPVGQKQMVNDKRILTDSSLSRSARIVAVNEGMTPGGLKRVQVELFNNSRYQKRFNYRFEWFDMNGMQVSTPANAALVPVVIEGKESKFITSVAPTPNCADFRLKIIEPYD